MITLPTGFDTAGLVGEFFSIALQIVPLMVVVAVGFLVIKILKGV